MTAPTQQSDSGQNNDEATFAGSPDTYQLSCEYCDEILQTSTLEAIYGHGTTHLEDHRNELRRVFAEQARTEHCQNDCGYVFPDAGDKVATFECPDCEHDNFESFAQRYVYWQMELL